MALGKASGSNPIDPIKVCLLALKQIKCAGDYDQIGSANSPETLSAAWEKLTPEEQERITNIVNNSTQPDPQAIALELVACGNLIELQSIKSQHGDVAVKAAWKLLPPTERDRIKALCDPPSQSQPEPEERHSAPEPQPVVRKPTLIELTAELEQLDNLLETIEGDIPVELQAAVDQLLNQRETTQDAVLEKLDNYAALIQNRAYWAATRKAEADRLAKLAESDFKTVDFLKGRLKAHLEATEQKKLRTKHYNISVITVGGKQSLRLNLSNPKDLPKRFQRVIIEPDNTALREALFS